jgi:hypothetical protein
MSADSAADVKEAYPCPKGTCDKFDTAGDYVATGARATFNAGSWVYDEGKKAYVWVTSPEVQEKVHAAVESVKSAASSAYDSAADAYAKYQKDHPSPPPAK